ncbi:MAG: hypothetical protein A2V70_00545 [Planctomycetes bacterium RBG_13_63_9]|nr:MAG: hypothetical protein A2V70_00545 [Planctomycetes bacterium RBG_13_63_9]
MGDHFRALLGNHHTTLDPHGERARIVLLIYFVHLDRLVYLLRPSHLCAFAPLREARFPPAADSDQIVRFESRVGIDQPRSNRAAGDLDDLHVLRHGHITADRANPTVFDQNHALIDRLPVAHEDPIGLDRQCRGRLGCAYGRRRDGSGSDDQEGKEASHGCPPDRSFRPAAAWTQTPLT